MSSLDFMTVAWGVVGVWAVRKVYQMATANDVEDEKLGMPTEMKDTAITLKVPDVVSRGPYAVKNGFF